MIYDAKHCHHQLLAKSNRFTHALSSTRNKERICSAESPVVFLRFAVDIELWSANDLLAYTSTSLSIAPCIVVDLCGLVPSSNFYARLPVFQKWVGQFQYQFLALVRRRLVEFNRPTPNQLANRRHFSMAPSP